jgi:hypothetical protein
MVFGVVTLLPLLVSGCYYWLVVTTDVTTHNGHDHHDCKQLLIDDLEKINAIVTRVSKELG